MNPESEEQIIAWTVRYLAGELDGAELDQLSTALESSSEARSVFDEVSQQAYALSDAGEAQFSQHPPARTHPERPHWGMVAMAIAAAVAMMFVLFNGQPETPKEVAQIRVGESQVSLLLDESGDLVRRVAPGSTLPIQAGQGFKLEDHGATLEALYPDGSRLSVFGHAEVRLHERETGGKRIAVSSGQFEVEVTPQPHGKPLIIQTPTSSIEVLGTRLEVTADAESTQVAVSSGKVALVRYSDSARIEIPAGKRSQASGSDQEPLSLKAVPELRGEWEADFDDELPDGWKCGKWLPEQGAVLAHPNPNKGYDKFSISSGNAWRDGHHSYFQIHEDSVLHLTYKMERPGWFQIMLNLRGTPDSTTGTGNVFYKNSGKWNRGLAPGEWRTIHIPLKDYSKFIGKHQKPKVIDLTGLAAFQIYLSSHEDDHGLVVDRIWVTREPAGSSKTKSE